MYRIITEQNCTLDKGTGYLYFCDKEHPLANGAASRVLYHRHLASLKLNRWILPNEVVHHINHNKLDNRLENLEVLTASEHATKHAEELGLCTKQLKKCIKCNKEFLAIEALYCSRVCKDLDSIKNKEITKELLDELIPKYTWVALGKLFGYSDNGIKKRAKALGCIIPKRK